MCAESLRGFGRTRFPGGRRATDSAADFAVDGWQPPLSLQGTNDEQHTMTTGLPAARNDYERQLLANVARYGWHCSSISRDPDSQQPAFAYTVGFWHSWQQPEFVIAGLDSAVAHALLADLAAAAAAGKMWPLDQLCHDLIDSYPCAFIEVPKARREELALSACWLYGREPFPLMQVVWPDVDGRFPWHERASTSFRAEQPVWGLIA